MVLFFIFPPYVVPVSQKEWGQGGALKCAAQSLCYKCW